MNEWFNGYPPKDGIYWERHDKYCILKRCIARCIGNNAPLCGPIDIGEPLKRRPRKEGWYVMTVLNSEMIPVYIRGRLLMTEPHSDYYGLIWTVRDLDKLKRIWLKGLWYGPFVPPED